MISPYLFSIIIFYILIQHCSSSKDINTPLREVRECTHKKEELSKRGLGPIDIKSAKFTVNILIKEVHFCVGSYVKPLWVLTVARCISLYDKNDYRLAMGITNAGGQGGSSKKAANLFTHDKYSEAPPVFDIGLIKLESPFQISNNIGFIGMAESVSYLESKCVLIGWAISLKDTTNLPPSAQLESTPLALFPPINCENEYKSIHYDIKIDASIICGSKETDVCSADTGSLLVCDGKLTGLMSATVGCGQSMPSIFSSVPFFHNWIQNTIISNDSGAYSRGARFGSHFILLSCIYFGNCFTILL